MKKLLLFLLLFLNLGGIVFCATRDNISNSSSKIENVGQSTNRFSNIYVSSVTSKNGQGIYYDTNNDGITDISFNTDGTIDANSIDISSGIINSNSVIVNYLTVNSTSYFAGNVGIGVTAGSYPLEITSTSDQLNIKYDDARSTKYTHSGIVATFGSVNNDLVLQSNGGNASFGGLSLETNGIRRMYIDKVGNVGIGANNIITAGLVDGRDISVDGANLDAVIISTGALELSKVNKAGDTMTGKLTVPYLSVTGTSTLTGLVNGRDISADGATLDAVIISTGAIKTTLDAVIISTGAIETSKVSKAGDTMTGRLVVSSLQVDTTSYFVGNVGIGTTSPTHRLQILGTGLLYQGIMTTTTGSTNEAGIYLKRGDWDFGYAQTHYGTGAVTWWSTGMRPGDNNFHIWDGADRAIFRSTGMWVNGTVEATTFSGSGALLTTLNAGNISSGTLGVARGGTGATTFTGVLKGNGTGAVTAMTGTEGYITRWSDANTLGASSVIYDNGTNVGIGTTTVSSRLVVNGTIEATTFSGSSALLTSDIVVNEITIGKGTGNNTSSTALGYQALLLNTSAGNRNTAIGYRSLAQNEDGLNNTAIGSPALYSNKSGSSNISIGYLSANTLQTGSNNIIIGAQANVSNSASTNEIVIGQNVIGKGDNTAIIGNSATTTFFVNGNVDLQGNGLKDTLVTTAVKLGDSGNTSFATTNKTIIGAVNELNSKLYSPVVIQDVKDNNVEAGGSTAGTWVTRDLGTVTGNSALLSSSTANAFTLPAGTYYIEASAPSYKADRHKIRLYNVTDSTTVCYGSVERSDALDSTATRSHIRNVFTIAGTKQFRIDHICSTTTANYGLGIRANFGAGISEIYTQVIISKIN